MQKAAAKPATGRRLAIWGSLAYMAVASCWLVFADALFAYWFGGDTSGLAWLLLKDGVPVAGTGALLYLLMRRPRRRNRAARSLSRADEQRAALLVLGFTALMVGGILANLVFELVQSRNNVVKQTGNNGNILAHVLEEQTLDSVNAVELALQSTVKVYQSAPAAGPERQALVMDMLDTSIRNLPYIRAIWLLGPDGTMIHDSQRLDGKYNLADRTYFKVHRDRADAGLYIDDPVISKLGVPFIGLSRRINLPDGSFGGVIVAALEPKYLRRFYDSIKVGKDGVVALAKSDRTLLLRVPASAGAEGAALPSLPHFLSSPRPPSAGEVSGRSPFDAVQRRFFYRQLPGNGLVVVVGLGEEEQLADWRDTAQTYIAVSVVFVLMIAWFSYRALRELRKRNSLNHALRDSDSDLQAAQQLARIGSWRLDIASRRGVLSQQMIRILGLAQASELPSLAQLLERLHPDERGMIEKAIRERREFVGELRSNPAHGPVRHFDTRSSKVHDSEGNFIALMGTFQDITERRQAEAKLELASRVFQHTRDAIVVADAGGAIEAVNAAFERITQYGEHEVLGKGIRLLRSNMHGPGFYRQLWESVRKLGHWRGEVWSRRKNGDVFPVWLTIDAISSNERQQAGFVGVFTDMSEITQANEELRFLVNHDPLTRLPNRALLNDRLQQAIEAAQPEQRKMAVLLLNIDRLQRINDSIGHDAGDLLLREMAQRLLARLQAGDTLARLGSDEFVMLLTHVDDSDAINASAQHLLGAIAATCRLLGHELSVTASIGIAIYPLDGTNPGDLIRNADTALAHVKSGGRNSFRYFAAEMNTHALHWMSLEHRLRSALARGEFELHYQPQVRLADNSVCGAEALIRWRSAELGMISPAEFIPLAEDTGLIVEIGAWVLRSACAQNAAWQRAGLAPLPVAVNVSAHQITAGNLPALVRAALAESDLSPSCLAIELTESVLMREAKVAMRQIDELRAMGVKVALDDFGTGFSSLSYLSRFALDKLKIDQSFVRNITADPKSAAIAKATIALAHGLGIAVVAEGVETREQLDYLRGAGCDEVQGYYFSRPVAAMAFPALLNGELPLVAGG